MPTRSRCASWPIPEAAISDLSTDLEQIGHAARLVLDSRFAARERGLSDSRRAIRASANAIRSLHRGEMERADSLITEAAQLLSEAEALLAEHTETLNANFYVDAVKEYSEAELTRAMFTDRPLPTPDSLSVDPVPYLHGLGEAVGECRRRLLDRLRDGDLDTAQRLLTMMDAVVDLLADIDYPDGMTNGLRRTTDVARSLVERSRSDLTATVVQERLRRDLGAAGTDTG